MENVFTKHIRNTETGRYLVRFSAGEPVVWVDDLRDSWAAVTLQAQASTLDMCQRAGIPVELVSALTDTKKLYIQNTETKEFVGDGNYPPGRVHWVGNLADAYTAENVRVQEWAVSVFKDAGLPVEGVALTALVKPRTPAERVAKLRAEAKRKGWKRREYYATPGEHTHLKNKLGELRT